MTRSPPRAAALALLALGLAGCPRRTPPPDLSLEAEALKEQLVRAQAEVRSVQGDARVRVTLAQGTGAVAQFIAAEKPDRLHVEAHDFFGNVVAVLVAADGRFALYDARESTYYQGPATPENLARLVPLPLRAEELVTILCGGAPLVDAPARSATPGAGHVVLELADGARRQVVHVGEDARPERSELAGAVPSYALRFEAFRTRTGGVRFPTDVALRSDDPKVGLELHWKTVELNGALDASLFRLEAPRGAKVVDLGEGPPPHAPPNLFEPGAAPAGAAP